MLIKYPETLVNTGQNRVQSSLEQETTEEGYMNQVNCPVCGEKCVKSGKTKAGSQRWLCKSCKSSLTHKINNETKELQMFLEWLFGKNSQSEMPGEGRIFRRKTSKS